MSNTLAPTVLRPRRAKIDLVALRERRAYDLVMRLPVLSYSLFLAFVSAVDLSHYFRAAGPAAPTATLAVGFAMRLSVIAYFVVLAASVTIRARPRGRAQGIEPRISALVGTFLIPVVVLFPRHALSMTGEMVATVLVLAGNALAVLVLVGLGRSFSIMAEARQLVTTGVYRRVRHPLYLAEELAVFGLVLQFLSGWTLLLLAVQVAFQLRRIRNEERVLSETFPEYAAYRQKTAMLLPGVY
jgi:protein-S-isoprenylcysteine O-methyltransferase Ste14